MEALWWACGLGYLAAATVTFGWLCRAGVGDGEHPTEFLLAALWPLTLLGYLGWWLGGKFASKER